MTPIHYDPALAFKSKVALEPVKGQKISNEPATEFCVHISQINLWKKQLLEALPIEFSLVINI